MSRILASLKLWFPIFWLLVISILFSESSNPTQFYQNTPGFIKYLLYAFAFAVALFSGYRVFQKLDINPSSDRGIFGLKLLSLGIMIGSFFLFFLGAYYMWFSELFVKYESWRISLGREIIGLFFLALSFVLIVVSGYLLFKFQRRAGIIVYRG